MFIALALAPALLIGAGLGVVHGMQRSLIYFPAKDIPSRAAAKVPEMQEVRLATTDGLELRAWWRPARADWPTLVYFHGNSGHIGAWGHRMRPFLDLGLGVLQVDYRGYGGNPGEPTEAGLYADGRAAFSFLADAGVPPEHCVIYGESLGTGVAVEMAFEQATKGPPRPVRGLILEAPFDSMAAVAADRFPFLPVDWLLKDRYDSMAKIGAIRTSLLVVQGEADDVVPVAHGRRLFEAAHEPKQALWLPGVGHRDIFEHGGSAAVLPFLRQCRIQPGAGRP